MTVEIRVALRGGAEEPAYLFTHVSEDGAGFTLEGEHDQWAEVYCLDDNCGWTVRMPADSLGVVLTEPAKPAEEPAA